jgi:FkbM family methyltransferase
LAAVTSIPDPVRASPPRAGALARRLRFIRTYGRWRRNVRELWRFKWRENRKQRVVGAYHTRRHGVTYFVRHATRDVGVFSEIFVYGEYQPPAGVAERLSELGRPPRVLDVGGNIGLFSAFAREHWPGARVVSIEPDPENLQLLRRMKEGSAEVEVIEACAGVKDGVVRFVPGLDGWSHVEYGEAGENAIELPSVDVFPLAEHADLVKIDIEGSEWRILDDARLATLAAPIVVMEWHDLLCPHPDPGPAARRALERAGYEIVAELIRPPHTGTLWALRPDPLA